MSRVLFVTGTDTGVGKTVVTAALAAAAAGAVAVVKPAQTGVTADEAGDLQDVERLTGLTDLHEGIRLLDPLAPTTAGRRQGVPLPSVDTHAKALDDLAAERDLVIVEGAGGLLVGLDEDGHDLADLAARLSTPCSFVVVTRSGLGTLNHTGLTVEALRVRGLPITGLVIGSWPVEPDLAERCNAEDLPATTGVPLVGRVPAGAGQLDRESFRAAAPTWFTVPNLAQ
ncbi:dethiobiotin synthase [Kribbella flavida DSM 17836]|uniref:ATP-dependent dethiobiotin synthetase BioD n=1 Tax=Kribbella flavida (strain DSM 17836 / JCM 10339 / NBRC 14399) TaxID=479435 RepID=D2PSW2_KRIFD|nr:dethiobiotin synthase [Kribbella flavida]ADB35014.1 dethiobiotin synthase [Kribbella flavida DSM 17836]